MKKEAFKALFQGQPTRPVPFIPLIYTYASKVMQLTVKEQLTDPTKLALSLQRAQRLFNYDAVVCNFDTTLEAEALGCAVNWSDDGPAIASPTPRSASELEKIALEKGGRVPTVLEATRRLKMTVGREMPLLAGVTGPCALAFNLKGAQGDLVADRSMLEDSVKVMVKMVKAFCDLGCDGILVTDDVMGLCPPDVLLGVAEILTPVWNLCEYYQAPVVIITRSNMDTAKAALKLGAKGISLGCDIGELRQEARLRNMTVVDSLNTEDLLSDENTLSGKVKTLVDSAAVALITTDWQVPLSVRPDAIHQIVRAIRAQ